MANINELDLAAEDIDVSFDEMPEPSSGFIPPPKPGSYKFTLPVDLSSVWDKVETKDGRNRIKAVFDSDHPLTYVALHGSELAEHPWTTQVSNIERSFGKDGPKVSDMAWLLKALGEETSPRTNMEYAQALMKHAGESFIADVEWSTSCNENRDIRVYEQDENGNTTTVIKENTPGCGRRFYQRDLPKGENGSYLETFECSLVNCDSEHAAVLRCFGNLRNFRAAN